MISTAVAFWNASVRASKIWGTPRTKDLRELKTRMKGAHASREAAATFDELEARWREHLFDPRLVASWTYERDGSGAPRLVCTMALLPGVEADVPPPLAKRVSVGGTFLDEVRIALSGTSFLSFPVDRHRAVVDEHGTATVYAMMPTALQLFADGRLPRVGGDVVGLVVGGRELGPMVLANVFASGDRHDVAALVFRRADARRA